jgi:hypothetical protein
MMIPSSFFSSLTNRIGIYTPVRFFIISLVLSFSPLFCGCLKNDKKITDRINRQALVRRHIPSLSQADTLCPFSVGNGEFAFTVDITGLQTFDRSYEKGIPLATQSQWSWHSIPNPDHYSLQQTMEDFNTYGRQVPYPCKQNSDAGQWLRSNPHRLHLGKIGFRFMKSDSAEIHLSDISEIHQTADIWQGIIKSSFTIDDNRMEVVTACHPRIDQIAVHINSKLLHQGRVAICFDFPCYSLLWGKDPADWSHPEKHTSDLVRQAENSVLIKRVLDDAEYYVSIGWEGRAHFHRISRHTFLLEITAEKEFAFTCCFSKKEKDESCPDANETIHASNIFWKKFWESGGAVDLSGCRDSRAFELERRIVLSRYLTAIQCCGSVPPQETGLTCNSWYGKFHLEMHWWHAVHFVLWGHPELLEKSMWWYQHILPAAQGTARLQGYEGARWPKMVADDGRESPSAIGVFLIWQQPHPIYYAELLYRCTKDQATLQKYRDLVFATAEFMASYANWDDKAGRYVLGPPLIPAQEIYPPDSTMNPTFELSYWTFGLQIAQKWRERLGLARMKKWDDIIATLAHLPVNKGTYQNAETAMNTFSSATDRNDHPSLLGAFGMVPNNSIDIEMMRNTLEHVMQSWNWDSTWGWDYPLIAMTAARVGRPEIAIDALLMDVPKNRFLLNGHNYQNGRLPVYLPGNGGLLAAVAMMAAGWDGAPAVPAPGFPHDGNWNVKFEGLSPLP